MVIKEVLEERRRQDGRWGEQNHSPLVWLAILSEEAGEAAKAVLERKWEDYRKEMIQVAAVAIAAAQAFDRLSDQEPRCSCACVPDASSAAGAVRERCATIVESFAAHYPVSVFPPPSPGEHGKTVDACSARAIRCILPVLATLIRQNVEICPECGSIYEEE
jgi:NTP pyrophosphatase (non-canonical NTP hydrolase)